MAHKRESIRNAVVSALSGLSTTGSKVYASRVYPLEGGNLPGLLIYTIEEESEIRSISGSVSLLRRLSLVVEGNVKDTGGTIDNKLDDIAEEVEAAINADITLDDNVQLVHLASTEIEFNADTDKPVGTIKMLYIIEYITG